MADDVPLKIQIITEADNTGFKSAAEAGRELKSGTEKITDATDDLSRSQEKNTETAHHSQAEHKAVHAILHKLNELVPGLGSTINLLSKAHGEAAAAARAGTAANEGFIASMGPLAVVLLAIQAAEVYWDLYKEHAKEAGEATQKTLENTVESLREARKAQEEFNEAVAGGKEDPTRKFAEKERAQDELLKARIEQNKELLKIQKEQAVAAAATPEAKEAAGRKFDRLISQQDVYGSEIGLGNKRSLIEDVQADIALRTRRGAELNQQFADIGVDGDPARRAEISRQLTEQTEALNKLNELLSRLQSDAGLGEELGGVKSNTARLAEATRVQTDNTIPAGVAALFANEHGAPARQTQDAINALRASYETVGGSTDALLSAIRYSHQMHLTQNQQIQLMRRQMATLAAQINSTPQNNR